MKFERRKLSSLLLGVDDSSSELSNALSRKIAEKVDDIFIEGLKRKGIEFKDKIELESFVKENCMCEDNNEERKYFVHKIPFLLHKYSMEKNSSLIEVKSSSIDGPLEIFANYGYFYYL